MIAGFSWSLVLAAKGAWEPAVLGGLIPLLGLLAVGFIVYRAARDTDDRDPE
jgi:hypothetical protein